MRRTTGGIFIEESYEKNVHYREFLRKFNLRRTMINCVLKRARSEIFVEGNYVRNLYGTALGMVKVSRKTRI